MKTTFFLFLVEGTTVAPNLDSGLLASRWLLWHCTPIVFLSCETQTTHPMVSHSGHFIWSPTLTINWIPRFRYLFFARTFSLIFFLSRCSALNVHCVFYLLLLYSKRISDSTGLAREQKKLFSYMKKPHAYKRKQKMHF